MMRFLRVITWNYIDAAYVNISALAEEVGMPRKGPQKPFPLRVIHTSIKCSIMQAMGYRLMLRQKVEEVAG